MGWIQENIPAGVTQEKFIKSLIDSAQVERPAAKTNSPCKKTLPDFLFIDVFAGIGGFHIGMKINGGECVFANEQDKYSAMTYLAWTGFEAIATEDIRSWITQHRSQIRQAYPTTPNRSR